jgi:uncharacterized glyoxalase superfamily metalloenzyme YdcJ
MDKKYNGFNNGRDKSDGVGGREVNHGTQETMTKEQILAQSLFEQLTQERELHQQQLSAERERAGKLVEALKSIDRINYSQNISDIIEQTINEYDTATKES